MNCLNTYVISDIKESIENNTNNNELDKSFIKDTNYENKDTKLFENVCNNEKCCYYKTCEKLYKIEKNIDKIYIR